MKSLTELETLAAQRGYELKVFTEDGEQFGWAYRGDTEIPALRVAVAMSLRNYADRYFCIQITPCEMPDKIESDPAEYYARKEKEARELSERLDEARKAGAPELEIWRLMQALERARYVGD